MKDSHLTLRLPAELARMLARKARALGVPRSQMVREAVARYLAGPERTPVTDMQATRLTARALAARWDTLPRLDAEEADAFAADIAAGRDALPVVRSPWE